MARRVAMLTAHLRVGAVGVPAGTEPRCSCSRCRRARGLPGVDDAVPCLAGPKEDRLDVGAAECVAVRVREFTREELREFDGEGGGPVFLALKGVVFDVSAGRSFYGPNGGYAMLGGRDASKALAKMSLDVADVEEPSTASLTGKERDTLDSWFDRMMQKYPVVGKLV